MRVKDCTRILKNNMDYTLSLQPNKEDLGINTFGFVADDIDKGRTGHENKCYLPILNCMVPMHLEKKAD